MSAVALEYSNVKFDWKKEKKSGLIVVKSWWGLFPCACNQLMLHGSDPFDLPPSEAENI